MYVQAWYKHKGHIFYGKESAVMKKYAEPKVEFVELEDSNVITESYGCDPYVCPNSYGNTCTGLPVIGD